MKKLQSYKQKKRHNILVHSVTFSFLKPWPSLFSGTQPYKLTLTQYLYCVISTEALPY